MNDFKKMPKMACGGGVKKYNEGGDIVAEARKSIRESNSAEMPSRFGSSKPGTMIVDGKITLRNPPVEMPKLRQGNKGSSPTIMETKPSTNPRNNLEHLKKGGKVKRGNKK
jgi:hypothetical protein